MALIDVLKPGPPGTVGEHLAWAVRIDPSGVANQEYFGTGFAVTHGPEFLIAFFSASTGQYLAKYERFPPTISPTPGLSTPLPTNPP